MQSMSCAVNRGRMSLAKLTAAAAAPAAYALKSGP